MPVDVYTRAKDDDSHDAMVRAIQGDNLRTKMLDAVRTTAEQEAREYGGLAPKWERTAKVRVLPTLEPGTLLVHVQIRTADDAAIAPLAEEQQERDWVVELDVNGTATMIVRATDKDDAAAQADDIDAFEAMREGDWDVELSVVSVRPS
jgi:hypothetical protein